MSLSWIKTSSPFRPRLEALEDRTLPSATHFLVVAPQTANAGSPAFLEVVALDASNNRARDYTGTANVTSTDSAAKLPSTLTFQPWQRGVALLVVTPETAGSPDTVTVTDSANSSITGSATFAVNAAPVTTHLLVQALPSAYVGQPVSVLVVALDASNHLTPNYTGTVQLTSSTSATLPANYPFQASDHGFHLFTVTPTAQGSETITASDTSTPSISGQVTIQVNPAPVVTHLQVVVQPNAAVGAPTHVVVAALDASNHIVPTYAGTIQLSSSDSSATLPSSVALPTTYTFQPSDYGLHVFSITFGATGSQTVTAKDIATSSITGSATVNVGPSTGGMGGGFGGDLGDVFDHLFFHFRHFF